MANNIQKLQAFNHSIPKIYAYTLPEIPEYQGKIKIGFTTRGAETRIKEQVGTLNLKYKIIFEKEAKKLNKEYFKDYHFHNFLTLHKNKRKEKEWFSNFENDNEIIELFDEFIKLDFDIENNEYFLREEQARCVDLTLQALNKNSQKFLWNAKPRFGKTLTTFDFILKSKAKQILIITGRPAIFDSWKNDFDKFIKSKTNLQLSALNLELIKLGAQKFDENKENILFLSFQHLNSLYKQNKLDILGVNFDLLIIDESHEYQNGERTSEILPKIKRKFELHLSGTPFKALANNEFFENQIFNWTYTDEQMAKAKWFLNNENENPYLNPQINFLTFQLSEMLKEQLQNTEFQFAFDLNEFFKIKNDKFIYQDEVEAFLNKLTTLNFPFSKQYKEDFNHTFWLLPGVKECRAMQKTLEQNPFFKDYKIILAAGKNEDKANEKALQTVKNAIKNYDKTITLSCGQLTTGITIPEWSAIFMLNNISSSSLYMQAVFRVQNPYTNGEYTKENCFVFDFAPDRTLKVIADFAVNLNSSNKKEEQKIKELINFLPVLSLNENGDMQKLDEKEILSLPNLLNANSIVQKGFIDNKLFNFSFNKLPKGISKILNKLDENKQGQIKSEKEIIVSTTNGLLRTKNYNKTKSNTDADINKKDKNQELKKQIKEIQEKLQSFTQTIPTLLLAFCNENTSLANLTDNISNENFEQITKITKNDFEKLKNGWTYLDENGSTRVFEGIFNETLFNIAIKEFFKEKQSRANYLESDTNIFELTRFNHTNFEIVNMQLSDNNFSNPYQKFFDPNIRSGTYLSNIVKNLYQNEKMKQYFPNDNERLTYILEKQIYGFCENDINFNIANNYLNLNNAKLNITNINQTFNSFDEEFFTNKSQIMQFLNDKFNLNLTTNNTTYSKVIIKKASKHKPQFWFEINKNKTQENIFLLLSNQFTKMVYLFEIPEKLLNLENSFYREDKNTFAYSCFVNDLEFKDTFKREIYFKKYLKTIINFNKMITNEQLTEFSKKYNLIVSKDFEKVEMAI